VVHVFYFIFVVVVGIVFVIFGFIGEIPRGCRIIWNICAVG
jgi:hypothetical protein